MNDDKIKRHAKESEESKLFAKPRIISKNENRIAIINDNILYNNGIITAYYILPTINYSTTSEDGILASITSLENLFTGLASRRPGLTFTISQIDKIVEEDDVRKNLLQTIKLYSPDFEMPEEFSSHITSSTRQYSIVGIDIQQRDISDIEKYTLKDTIKDLAKQTMLNIAGVGNINVDVEKVTDIENNIYGSIGRSCVRASKDLVFYNFISKLFPSYDISYDELSYINEKSYESIMGSATQVVSDAFGMFQMHNDGVDVFGLEPVDTYGCILNIKSFPDDITTANFKMTVNEGVTVTTVHCMKKEDARLKLRRNRSNVQFEFGEAVKSSAENESLQEQARSIDVATEGIEEIDNGELMCEFNCSILITATSVELLKHKVLSAISSLKDRRVLATKSLTQAADFIDNYVNMKPQTYNHFASLAFCLAFQQNNGSAVGDYDASVNSPSIGEDILG